jgi:hypothetical protein
MSDLIEDLKAKLLHSTELIQQIASERNRRTGRSPNTEHDYLRLAQTLLTRAKTADGGLIGAVSDTRRPTTFRSASPHCVSPCSRGSWNCWTASWSR